MVLTAVAGVERADVADLRIRLAHLGEFGIELRAQLTPQISHPLR